MLQQVLARGSAAQMQGARPVIQGPQPRTGQCLIAGVRRKVYGFTQSPTVRGRLSSPSRTADVSTAASTLTQQEERTSEEQQPAQEQFSWFQQWYPVAAVDYLDPSKPHPITVLGKNLVLWRDGSGTWRCFEDACPHRLAPLSEGRIEKDGTLLCAYHAWRFDGEGKLTSLPQVKDKESFQQVCANPRSCATSYPLREAQGLLFVWPQGGPMAALEAAAKQPTIIPELDEYPQERVKAMPWFFRDLPYGADYFVENVTDPAHVNVSHHNVAGNRYVEDQYFDVEPERPLDVSGFRFRLKPRYVTAFGNVEHSTTEWLPPSLVKIKSIFKDGAQLILVLYATPTTPGNCRHMGRQILIKNEAGRLPPGLSFFAAPMPVWLAHTTASLFLHQDQLFLHQQEKTVAARGTSRSIEKYMMPTVADKTTIAYRSWFEQLAGGAIPFEGSRELPPVDRTKEKVFDTFHSHTAQCSVCSRALKNLQLARSLAIAVGVASVLAAAVCTAVAASAKAAVLVAAGAAASAAAGQALASAPPAVGLACLALGALCGGAALVMSKLVGMMHKYEFSHAENH